MSLRSGADDPSSQENPGAPLLAGFARSGNTPNSKAPNLDPTLAKARGERRRALIVPREHGAWGLLLVPMITGAGVAFRESGNVFPFVLLLAAALSLFWMRTPVESLLGTSAIRAESAEERRTVMFAVACLATIAAMTLGMLLWAGKNRDLWLIGAAAGAAFVAQAALKKLGRWARMLSELVGTIGLTSAAPAAYYVITGEFGRTAWILWAANFLFAGNQIHYVQLRIHTAKTATMRAKLARGWTFASGQLAMAALLCAAALRGLIPWLAIVAFVPLLFRGWFYFLQKPAPLQVRRLGWSELAHAVAFCILFTLAFAL